jgi:hypothetical protein
MRTAIVVVAATACCACAPAYVARPGVSLAGTVLETATGPLSYQAATPRDAGAATIARRTVRGEACQHAIVLPVASAAVFFGKPTSTDVSRVPPLGVAWGDGGYARALEGARASARGATLYDVRADTHITAILGVYVRSCLEVHAEVAAR